MTSLTMPALLTFVAVLVICRKTTAAAYTPPELSRRKAVDLAFRHASIGASFLLPIPTFAADFDTDARLELPIETIKGKSYSISIPRVGYSLYKTSAEEVPLCMELALQAGVQHFDVASFYGTNEQVGDVLKSFVQKGLELVPDPAPSKSERRKRLFVTHKVSNTEQSGNKAKVKKAVKDQLKKLNIGYLDMCMVHSPLTDKGKRLATYEALLDLQSEGVVRAVGTCNYGVNPLSKYLVAYEHKEKDAED